MAVRLAALLPRFVAVTLIWVLATAALTFAAGRRAAAPSKPEPAAPAQRPVLVVPEVRHQVYVFAKGMLQDAGFAWRVSGRVRGYAGNVVVAQEPVPGTRVLDTGAPTIVLQLAHGSSSQRGAPVDASPYPGTRIERPEAAVKPARPAPAKPARKSTPKHVARTHAKPAPAQPKQVRRPPAFVVPGAPKEPLNEISLPARARLLAAWVGTGPQATNRNVRRWLYQHAWIVTGARFGWWHGARALQTLIAVDRRIEALWGFGYRSEAVARAALRTVEQRAR
jgi:hypothetical protein